MSTRFLRIKEFPDLVQLSYYYHNFTKKSRFNNKTKSNFKSDSSSSIVKSSESLRCSISRTLSNMKDILYCNDFQYFVTFTFKDELRFDILSCVSLFKSLLVKYKNSSPCHQSKGGFMNKKQKDNFFWMKMRTEDGSEFQNKIILSRLRGNSRRELSISGFKSPSGRFGTLGKVVPSVFYEETSDLVDFKYIYVFELTKTKGLHVHGFFSGFYDLYINDFGHLSSKFFDDYGFQSFIARENVNDNYLLKYISKEPIKELKCRYFRSRNLNKPAISRFIDPCNHFLLLPFTFKGQYSSIVNIKK